jgi:hypothetical protein
VCELKLNVKYFVEKTLKGVERVQH